VAAASRRRRNAPIALLCAAPFLTVLDANGIAVALPSIREELEFSRSTLQWVIGAYGLAFGGGMLVAGRAADLYGPRRLLGLGLVLFTAASLAGALAPSKPVLLAARALQGLGAAAAFPASLALIAALFESGEPRNRALGVYGAVVSAAFVSGMIAGGLLTASLGWRSSLLLNCPIGAAAAIATTRLIPETPPAAGHSRLALPGGLAASAGLLALLYGLGLAARPDGGAAGAAAALAAALALLGIAFCLERSSPAPLVPAGLLRRREVRCSVLAALLTVGAGVGVVFVLTLYLQDVLGYDPLAAGLALTLLGVAGVSSGLLAPRIARRAGLTRTLAGALVVQAAGVMLLTRIGVDRGIEVVLVGTATLGFGHFAATVAFTALATAASSEDEHGIAVGVVSSAQQIGGAVGLAALVAVATARTGAVGGRMGPREAVVEGFRWALACGAGLSLLAAGLVLAVSGRRGPAPARRPARGWRTTRRPARSSRR
jgi:MFS family permease